MLCENRSLSASRGRSGNDCRCDVRKLVDENNFDFIMPNLNEESGA